MLYSCLTLTLSSCAILKISKHQGTKIQKERPGSNKRPQMMWLTQWQCEGRTQRVWPSSAVIEWRCLLSSYFSIKLASFRCNFSLIPRRLNPHGLHDSRSFWRRSCRSSDVDNDETAVWIGGTCHGFIQLPVLKSLCLKVQCVISNFLHYTYTGFNWEVEKKGKKNMENITSTLWTISFQKADWPETKSLKSMDG